MTAIFYEEFIYLYEDIAFKSSKSWQAKVGEQLVVLHQLHGIFIKHILLSC